MSARTTHRSTEDLTTTRAPFIEEAQARGELAIHQPYELYSDTNQKTWRRLYRKMEPKWRRHAHSRFLAGLDCLSLSPDRIPNLADVNSRLAPLTGFTAQAVSGYVPAYLFFDCLRQRKFPTTITIRDPDRLDYLPEPDIFHDVAGHVPMHTDPTFADALARIGEVARAAAERVLEMQQSRRERVRRMESVIKAMARFFWFTVEFGLMRAPSGRLEVYGSGLLSSLDEIEHAVESPDVQRYPFQLEWVVNQYFEIDHFQPLLFIIASFDQLLEEVDRLEDWVLAGKLDSVSPGEPLINETDLRSFLNESCTA